MVMFMCNNNIKNNVSHKNVSMLYFLRTVATVIDIQFLTLTASG